MRKRIQSDVSFQPSAITKDDALEVFRDQPYKIELINDIRRTRRLGSTGRASSSTSVTDRTSSGAASWPRSS
jgi:threonyl-tRNA synthetase